MGSRPDFQDLRYATVRDDLSQDCTRVAVTDSSAATALPSCSELRVVNLSAAAWVYVKTGGAAITAADTDSHPVAPQGEVFLKPYNDTHIATVCSSGETADLMLCPNAPR